MPVWLVAVLAFIAGGVFGVVVTAVCAYDAVKHPDKNWWEDT